MDEKIIAQFEVNVLIREESTDGIKGVFKSHGVDVIFERPIQKMRLSYDIQKQQYAFFATFEVSMSRDEAAGVRTDISMLETVIRVLITEKRDKKVVEKRSGEAPKKQSRLKSALQAMLPNEALEKKIEEILQ